MSYTIWKTGKSPDFEIFKLTDGVTGIEREVIDEMTREDATDLHDDLAEALGLYIHMPDGCEDDGCPCRQRKESQR